MLEGIILVLEHNFVYYYEMFSKSSIRLYNIYKQSVYMENKLLSWILSKYSNILFKLRFVRAFMKKI